MSESLTRVYTFRVTEAQHQRLDTWNDSAEYLRSCIDSRHSGNADDLLRRASDLEKAALALNTEARELKQLAAVKDDEDEALLVRMREEYMSHKKYRVTREQQVDWLCRRYDINVRKANEFLAMVGDAREGEA